MRGAFGTAEPGRDEGLLPGLPVDRALDARSIPDFLVFFMLVPLLLIGLVKSDEPQVESNVSTSVKPVNRNDSSVLTHATCHDKWN